MAEPTQTRKLNPAEERQRLLREIERSRRQLAGDLSGFGHAVNVRERFRDAVRSHPVGWLGGGVVAGLILAKIALPWPRRRPEVTEANVASAAKRSLFLGLLGIAGKQILRLSEPVLKRLAQEQLERWSQSRLQSPPSEDHLPSRAEPERAGER